MISYLLGGSLNPIHLRGQSQVGHSFSSRFGCSRDFLSHAPMKRVMGMEIMALNPSRRAWECNDFGIAEGCLLSRFVALSLSFHIGGMDEILNETRETKYLSLDTKKDVHNTFEITKEVLGARGE